MNIFWRKKKLNKLTYLSFHYISIQKKISLVMLSCVLLVKMGTSWLKKLLLIQLNAVWGKTLVQWSHKRSQIDQENIISTNKYIPTAISLQKINMVIFYYLERSKKILQREWGFRMSVNSKKKAQVERLSRITIKSIRGRSVNKFDS